MMSSYSCHESMNNFLCDRVNTVIIITILREVTCCLEVNDDTILITDWLNCSVLNS